MNTIQVIGIIGKLGSGKDFVGDYIAKYLGWEKFELSKIVKNEALELGFELSRENLIKVLLNKHSIYGKGYLVEETLKVVNKKGIITGIRLIEQISILKIKTQSILIYVDCERELRFQRQLKRMKEGDLLTIDDMDKIDFSEESDLGKRYFQNNVRKIVDFIVDNNGTEQNTKNQINLFLKNQKIII